MMMCIFKSFELFECEGLEDVPFALIEFVLEFDPVQSQWMQEALHAIHADEHSEGDSKVEREYQKCLNYYICTPTRPEYPFYSCFSTVKSNITAESWAWAKDKAQSLR